jgi:hypothetical protein
MRLFTFNSVGPVVCQAVMAMLAASAPVAMAAAEAEPQLETNQPWLKPYEGPTRTDVDRNSLGGKVLCGYQGWFSTPHDGQESGWVHWGRDRLSLGPGKFTVDLWPDTSEYAPEDLEEVTGMKMPDGSPAKLYSAYRKGPVLTHFRWMREYGLDGVFLSRFIQTPRNPSSFQHANMVLNHVREGCHREGRVWAMMLDVSSGNSTTTIMNDWIYLCDQAKVREDSRYLYHEGKPVVLLWGFGFRDRRWSPAEAVQVIEFFKHDPKYGGVYLIGGVDPHWRTLQPSSRPDPEWAGVYRSFDSLSPWDAGRYRNEASMELLRKNVWEPDLVELGKLGMGYMPTAFPGFSWENLRRSSSGSSIIPREKGAFYWRQFVHFKQLGIKTVFVGMFDEVDEGTAIYKVSNTPPPGNYFGTYEGMPSDWYLRLTGAATKMMRGQIPLSTNIPIQAPPPAAR